MPCCNDNPATAGELRHTIVVEQTVDVPDEYGGSEKSIWQDFVTIKCKMEFKEGNEGSNLGRQRAFRGWVFTARWIAGIDTNMRLRFDDYASGGLQARYFNIKYVRNLEQRNRWVIIKAIEGSVT